MVEVVWTEPALTDLDAIADYIALDKPLAAADLVQRVFAHVEQRAVHPRSGPKFPELKSSRHRQIVEPSCRVIYRAEKSQLVILHVIRGERLLEKKVVLARSKSRKK